MQQQNTNGKEEAAVLNTVKELNRLWTEKNTPSELARFFHPQMVAICAGVKSPIVGGDACVAGWTDFTSRVTELEFEEHRPLVRIVNDTAVVAYDFTCSFRRNGERFEMNGRDLFTLVRVDDRWQVIADHFSEMPA